MEAGYSFEGIQEKIDGVLSAQSAHLDPIEINVHHSDEFLDLGVMEWNPEVSDDVSLKQHEKFTGITMECDGIDDLSILGLYLLHHHLVYTSKKVIIVWTCKSITQILNAKSYMVLQNNLQQLLSINNKIQLTPNNTTMSAANAVAHVVQAIIQQGKEALKDKKIIREKVPPFSNRQSSANYEEIVIHAGFQAEGAKRHAHFTMRRDSMPEKITKDNLAIKTHQVILAPKSLIKQSPTFKSSQQKFYSSKKKSRQNNSCIGYGSYLEQRQKQNQLVKLEENHNNRIVVERVRLRAENEEDVMRQKKRRTLLKQYEEKLQNQVFQKQRLDRQAQKEKLIQNHMKKGDNFKFDFDHNGDLILFQTSNHNRPIFTPQTNFKINSQFEQGQQQIIGEQKMQRHKSFDSKGKQYADTHPLQRNLNEHQRIRSARGEAFASAVMKTVNLSRISMNGSVMEVDAEQFMKRNDLFNNNHSRQTTSIPYLQPIIGTVYTEIATNQVVGSNKERHSSTTALVKEDMSFQQRAPSRSGKNFEGFYQDYDRKYAKTARVLGNRDSENEDLIKTTSRPIKTAKQSARDSNHSARRPYTSINRGRITTANQKLVQNLLNND